MTYKEAYEQGLRDGLAAFAINNDGSQWVGDPRKELKKAQEDLEDLWNYDPPSEEQGEKL